MYFWGLNGIRCYPKWPKVFKGLFASEWHFCNGFCLRLIYHFQLSILSSRALHNCILKSCLTRRSCAGRLPLFPDSDWLDDEDPSMPTWPDGLIPLAELQGSVELFVPSDRKITKYIEANKCTGCSDKFKQKAEK